MEDNRITMGYRRNGLEYQPSSNALQSNYDMYMSIDEIQKNPEKFGTFVANALQESNPLTTMQLMSLLPSILEVNETTYMPNNEENYIGMKGAYNLNSINPINNGGRVKMRQNDKAHNPQMKSNKYYSNNY